jgi:hypothetical protein
MKTTKNPDEQARQYIDTQLQESRAYRQGAVSREAYDRAVKQTARLFRRYAALRPPSMESTNGKDTNGVEVVGTRQRSTGAAALKANLTATKAAPDPT